MSPKLRDQTKPTRTIVERGSIRMSAYVCAFNAFPKDEERSKQAIFIIKEEIHRLSGHFAKRRLLRFEVDENYSITLNKLVGSHSTSRLGTLTHIMSLVHSSHYSYPQLFCDGCTDPGRFALQPRITGRWPRNLAVHQTTS